MNHDSYHPSKALLIDMEQPELITVTGPRGSTIYPNFLKLCVVPAPCGTNKGCTCSLCLNSRMAMTPRNAHLIFASAVDILMIFSGGLPFFEDELPPPARNLGEEFLTQFNDCFIRLMLALTNGQRPELTCTADEMLMHIVLSHADDVYWEIGSGGREPEFIAVYEALPANRGDADMSRLREIWFEDHDVLLLRKMSRKKFEKSLLADPDNFVNPANWFKPFRS